MPIDTIYLIAECYLNYYFLTKDANITHLTENKYHMTYIRSMRLDLGWQNGWIG